METKLHYHTPALLAECIDALDIRPDGIYVDATFGGGGHSRAILEKLGPKGRLISFDKDSDAWGNAPEDERLTLVPQDFIYIKNFLRYFDALPADGILADLGISFHQVDEGERGFSFRFDAPLDMRMDRESTRTAGDIINTYSAAQLQSLFSEYGEVTNAKTLARAIVDRRKGAPLRTTGDLSEVAESVLPGKENLKKYLAPVFQALRIEVNGELEGLKNFLSACSESLRPGGRLAIISYHSLEDRLVKNFLSSGDFEGKAETDVFGRSASPWKVLTKKPVTPSEEEIESNPRSRSAKLRVAERVKGKV